LGEYARWKTFHERKLRNLTMPEAAFTAPHDGYRCTDPAFASMLAQLRAANTTSVTGNPARAHQSEPIDAGSTLIHAGDGGIAFPANWAARHAC